MSRSESNFMAALLVRHAPEPRGADRRDGRIWTREGLGKRIFDIGLAIFLLVFTLPLFFVVVAAIKATSRGPVFFTQERYGLHRRPFTILKFRTMYADRCDRLAEVQTLRDDGRVTPLGRWLRRTSIDELPQLINILRGEMSFVGPRPHAVGMRTEGRRCEEIVAEYPRRYAVKPGLTGWAQVNGLRGPTHRADDLVRRLSLDLFYVDHRSVLLDLKILLLTPIRLLWDENAY